MDCFSKINKVNSYNIQLLLEAIISNANIFKWIIKIWDNWEDRAGKAFLKYMDKGRN